MSNHSLHPIHILLHLFLGIGWWLCLFSLNWSRQTEVIYIVTLLAPFFALFTLWILLSLASFFISPHKLPKVSHWLPKVLLWIDGLTLFTFSIYALNWQFFRSIVQAYLSIDAGNRYSSLGKSLSLLVVLINIICVGWFFFKKEKSPTTGL